MSALALVVAAAVAAWGAAVQGPQRGPVREQVTFLYYEDLDAAEHFYRTVVGLESTFDQGWVRIFRVADAAFVGLVDGERGSHRPSDDKPVMLSFVVEDVDEWFAHIRDQGVTILSEPADSDSVPVRAFLVADPGGYTVEFFQWLQRE